MDRWLEEYFAELETVFGLGLFSLLRSGSSGGDEGQMQAYAGSGASDAQPAWKRAPVQDEAYAFSAALEEQEININRMMAPGEEVYFEAAPAGESLAWESDSPAAGTRAADEKRRETAAENEDGGGIAVSRTEQDAYDEMAEKLFPDAESFEALLTPAVLTEQAESGGEERSAEKGQALWREAAAVRGKAAEEETAGGAAAAAFPEGRAAADDEMIDLLLDELERRLMLEVGGAAEGRY